MTWTTTKKAFVPIAVMTFNTCAVANSSLDLDYDLQSFNNEQKTSITNFCKGHWLTSNTETKLINNTSELIGVSDIIKQVKIGMGLPNKEIAKIFGVTRQTLYNHLKSDANVNANTRQRSMILKSIFDKLTAIFEKSPAAMAKNFTMNEQSLLDLLSKEELEFEKIIDFSKALNKRMYQHNSVSNSVSNDITLIELTRHS